MRVIVNTSPLIALERIGQLDLLKRMYGVIVRPQSVLDELTQVGAPTIYRRRWSIPIGFARNPTRRI
jgi:predicted nucleic acid-binding protein